MKITRNLSRALLVAAAITSVTMILSVGPRPNKLTGPSADANVQAVADQIASQLAQIKSKTPTAQEFDAWKANLAANVNKLVGLVGSMAQSQAAQPVSPSIPSEAMILAAVQPLLSSFFEKANIFMKSLSTVRFFDAARKPIALNDAEKIIRDLGKQRDQFQVALDTLVLSGDYDVLINQLPHEYQALKKALGQFAKVITNKLFLQLNAYLLTFKTRTPELNRFVKILEQQLKIKDFRESFGNQLSAKERATLDQLLNRIKVSGGSLPQRQASKNKPATVTEEGLIMPGKQIPAKKTEVKPAADTKRRARATDQLERAAVASAVSKLLEDKNQFEHRHKAPVTEKVAPVQKAPVKAPEAPKTEQKAQEPKREMTIDDWEFLF